MKHHIFTTGVPRRGRVTALAALLVLAAASHAYANTLSGIVQYQDKVFSTVDGSLVSTPLLPARYVTLDFVRASNLTTVLATTTTDDTGAFASPNVGSWNDVVVLVKAMGTYQNQTVTVRDQTVGGGAIQTCQSITFNLSGGSLIGQIINITADSIAGAFNIYDCFVRAHKSVRETFFPTPPAAAAFSLIARWEYGKDTAPAPDPGAPHSTTEFFTFGGTYYINVLGNAAVDSDAFDDSVLAHEYGHLVANLYSKDNSPGGPHLLGQALDLRLAWSEGWADFFCCAVTASQWYVDTNAAVPIIFEVATPSVTGAPALNLTGPESELAVACVLWNILNSAVTINNGNINTPREAIWDIFDNYLPTPGVLDVSLEDFWDGLYVKPTPGATSYARFGANEAALKAIIAAHDIRYYTDTYESNEDPTDSTPAAADGTLYHATLYYDANHDGIGDGDQDWFWFIAGTGNTYTIETLNLGNSADTVLQLYGTDGTTLLASNDDYNWPTSAASQIVHTFVSGGKVYVRVTRSAKPLPSGCRANYGYYDLRIAAGGAPAGLTVALISPFNGATGVAINTTVVATFSQPVKLTTVNTTSFTLTAVSTPVTGTVTLDASRTVATFTPSASLLYSTIYTVNLTNAILDDSDQPLAAFTSTFQTASSGPPVGPVPRVPRAIIAAGDGFVEVQWQYPTAVHDGVIVAVGRTRFPTISAVNQNGTVTLVVANGTEVYRGNTSTGLRIVTANGQMAFVAIWTFIGTTVSQPYQLASRAARGARGILHPLAPPAPAPPPGKPTLPSPQKFQAVSGDGFIDAEWLAASGSFDGVIVAAGSRAYPKLEQVYQNGTWTLTVTGGTEIYRGGTKVCFRLATGNGTSRLFCIWTYKGYEYSRPLFAATRAARGALGLTQRQSFYGAAFQPPGPP